MFLSWQMIFLALSVLPFRTDAASSVSFSSIPASCQAPGAAQNLIFWMLKSLHQVFEVSMAKGPLEGKVCSRSWESSVAMALLL